MISYEIAMGMSTVCVLLLSGNVSLSTIIQQQATMGWNVLLLSIAFFIFLVSSFAETNRLPFDLPEAESELVAGYHTEYSAMKFSFFFIAEYANMVTASALITSLFFGGWDIPFTQWDNLPPFTVLKTVLTLGVFLTKVLFFVFFFMWIRWTVPRFRYDQLMSLGWKVMLPLALAYITIIATVVLVLDRAGVVRGPVYGAILFGMNVVLAVLLFVVLDRGRIVSPAYSRLDREEVARLRDMSAGNPALAEKKA
jgi:NADH-quinone oxidoreductase subunit H